MFDVEVIAKYKRYPHDYYCEFDRDLRSYDSVAEQMKQNPIDDWSYAYLSHFVQNEQQGLAFVEQYERLAGAGLDHDLTLAPGEGNCGTGKLYRLRTPEALPKEIECLRTQMHSVPVVLEWPGNHRPPGGKVVFLDGHTQYMAYPSEFPMTAAFVEALRSLDKLNQKS
jgi:hypothetical protein